MELFWNERNLCTYRSPCFHCAALSACDKNDGIADDIVSDPPLFCHSIRHRFLCKGANVLDCLALSQVKARADPSERQQVQDQP